LDEPVSPLDDRYLEEVKELGRIFSERSLYYQRFRIELLYLKALCDLGMLDGECNGYDPDLLLKSLPEGWYSDVKEIETRTGHDVKAAELYLRKTLSGIGYSKLAACVHLGLTSEDVNGNAYGIIIEMGKWELLRCYAELAMNLAKLARDSAGTKIMGRTHGVPAVPTTFGKEMAYYALRLAKVSDEAMRIRPYGKLSGAVGSYNSFTFINEKVDWYRFSKNFIEKLGLEFPEITKQAPLWDKTSVAMHYIEMANVIMQELAQDLWLYNSYGIVKFERKRVGSSTMPHKVNPVDLEDSEGQAEVSNSILNTISLKLMKTRLQRDLSDSTVRRNIGVAFAHSLLACRRLSRALNEMSVIGEDVDRYGETTSEAFQIAFKLQGDLEGYERVFNNLDRLNELTKQMNGELKEKLSKIKPSDYVGLSEELAIRGSEQAELLARRVMDELGKRF
jgi:adenylosuccinate lyase